MHVFTVLRRLAAKSVVITAVFAVLLTAGCGGDSGGSGTVPGDDAGGTPGLPDGGGELPPPGEAQVDTGVPTTSLFPGQPLEVTCVVTPDKWAATPTEVRIVAGEAANAGIDAHTVTFSAPGTYDVACAIAGTDTVDPSPVTVTVSTAGATNVDTAVSPNPVVAGEAVTVTCSATDALGDPVTDVTFDIDVVPADGVTVAGAIVTPTKAGTIDVACAARSGATDASPARLTVEPGPLAKVAAQLTEPEIPAGGTTSVTCRATDQYGNGVGGYSFAIESDEGVEVNGAELTSSVTGLHEVNCRWVDGDDAAIAHTSAQLTVRSGAAGQLILSAVPAKATYAVGNQVTIEAEVIDEFGNPVSGAAIGEVTVAPSEGVVRLSDDAFRFAAEGQYTFSASLAGNAAVTDSITLLCDGAGPSVVIDFPLRGETLTGDSTITVTGVATDAVSGVASLTINGQNVTVAGDGSFTHAMQAVHGMNVIATEATDAGGQVESSWRSFYYSDAYRPVNVVDPTTSHVSRGILAFVAEETLDNDDPAMFDAAGLFTDILADLDLIALIPRPATTQSAVWCTYSVYIDSLTYGAPVVSLSTFGGAGEGSPGGMHIRAVLPNLSGVVDAPAPEFACPDVAADVTADSVVLEANLYLQVLEDGTVDSAVEVEDVTINGLGVEVHGVLGFLSNWLINFFEDDIAGIVEDQFVATIEDQVASLMGSLLDFLSLQEQFEIGPLVGTGPPVVLQLSAQVGAVIFTDAGVFASLNGAILAEKTIARNPLGAIARGSCTGGVVGSFEMPGVDPIELGIYDDLLNQALFSFWYNSGLELHLTPEDFAALGLDLSALPIGDLTLTTHLLLPPIIEGCADDGSILLQLGDGYVEASFIFLGTPTELSMYIQLAMDATLLVQPGAEGGVEIGILLGEMRTLEVEVVEINEEQAGKEKTFEDLLKSLVPNLLGDLAADPITFAIPSFDLGSLSESLPPDMWLTVEPSQLGRTRGYTTAAGRLVAGTPPAQ